MIHLRVWIFPFEDHGVYQGSRLGQAQLSCLRAGMSKAGEPRELIKACGQPLQYLRPFMLQRL